MPLNSAYILVFDCNSVKCLGHIEECSGVSLAIFNKSFDCISNTMQMINGRVLVSKTNLVRRNKLLSLNYRPKAFSTAVSQTAWQTWGIKIMFGLYDLLSLKGLPSLGIIITSEIFHCIGTYLSRMSRWKMRGIILITPLWSSFLSICALIILS